MLTLTAITATAIIAFWGGRAYEKMLWTYGYRFITLDGRVVKWDSKNKKLIDV